MSATHERVDTLPVALSKTPKNAEETDVSVPVTVLVSTRECSPLFYCIYIYVYMIRPSEKIFRTPRRRRSLVMNGHTIST